MSQPDVDQGGDGPTSLRSQRAAVFGLTFVVAFCSIVYELIYSELLRVLYGGTVVRYSITIGLFLFSFGIGSFLFARFDDDPSNFFRVEVLLSVIGPLGLLFIVGANVLPVAGSRMGGQVIEIASHLPIVAVGALSGLEVPYLTAMVGEGDSAFSEVLGTDYLGSLAGTVVWALVLYPSLGLVVTIFMLGLLNALAALAFGWRFSTASKALLAVCLIVVASYAGVVAAGETVERGITDAYTESRMEREYPSGQVEVAIDERKRTRYQNVVLYSREWTGPPRKWEGKLGPETCLRLDMHLQLCESWVDSYHSGLVDVPAAMVGNLSEKRVLVVGGGDWIAVDRLREHGATVDLVDLDKQFLNYTKDHPFFERYHDDAYEYDRLNVEVGDAYSYVAETNRTYDLVLLDLPGVRSDGMLNLYSTEFYASLASILKEDGVVVTWSYSRYVFPGHYEAYMNTVRAAGFEYHVPYYAYDDLDGDGDPERAEGFYVLAPDRPEPLDVRTDGGYVSRYADRYRDLSWQPVPHFRGVEPNSVFDPNYDLLVDYGASP